MMQFAKIVTQASSWRLRRLIGLAKKRIVTLFEEQLVSREDLNSAKDVEEVLEVLADEYDRLYSQVNTLEQYDRKWSKIIKKNPEEDDVKREYEIRRLEKSNRMDRHGSFP
uniref:Uncharacterized protein n=1 Tax=Caenorhabditis japonica TaxID=281687 RepID=A0A8R1HLU4_CAEJA